MSVSEKNEGPVSGPDEENLPAAEGAPAAGEPSAADRRREKTVRRVSAVLFALIFLFAGLVAGWFFGVITVDERARDIAWLVGRVADNYYEEIDDEELYDRLFHALELDRFCSYYNIDEYETVVSESKGNNSGYGVSLIYEGDAVRLYSTVYNSPAERAGLESGMYIYRYGEDKNTLQTATADAFYGYLSSHSSVTLEAGRGGEKKIYTLSREAYSAAYCEYRDSGATFRFRGKDRKALEETGAGLKALDGDTAYIRLAKFEGKASEEFEACLDKMKERGRKNLVLDLRSNGGGYLSTLDEIAAHLLKDAEGSRPLVASSLYRDGTQDVYAATGNDYSSYFGEGTRIRILADENTASASEALMGAMICYGTVSADDIYLRVSEQNGERVARTYGKGVMQSTFVAPDGRALRLTVARILWPDGRCIHGTGIRAEGSHAVEADPYATADDFLALL